MSIQATYLINPNGVASENFGDETVIIHISRGRYYSMKDSAMLLWDHMTNPISIQSLETTLQSVYTINAGTTSEDVRLFIHQLINEGLIIESENRSETAFINTPSIKKEYIKPVFEVFTDMESLILLDPIHDVSSSKGWPHKNTST